MSDNKFLTMKEIGVIFGMTSHQIGKLLKQFGLRTEAGKPSRMAFDGGYCDQRWTHDMNNYCWAWHAEQTVALLQKNGYKAQSEVDSRLE
jgi:hypothetical protein